MNTYKCSNVDESNLRKENKPHVKHRVVTEIEAQVIIKLSMARLIINEFRANNLLVAYSVGHTHLESLVALSGLISDTWAMRLSIALRKQLQSAPQFSTNHSKLFTLFHTFLIAASTHTHTNRPAIWVTLNLIAIESHLYSALLFHKRGMPLDYWPSRKNDLRRTNVFLRQILFQVKADKCELNKLILEICAFTKRSGFMCICATDDIWFICV